MIDQALTEAKQPLMRRWSKEWRPGSRCQTNRLSCLQRPASRDEQISVLQACQRLLHRHLSRYSGRSSSRLPEILRGRSNCGLPNQAQVVRKSRSKLTPVQFCWKSKMRSWQARLFAVLFCIGCAAGQKCGVIYDGSYKKPLLFGGVNSGCSAGCKPRDSNNYWCA